MVDDRPNVEHRAADSASEIEQLRAECRRLSLQLRTERRRAKADVERRLEFRVGKVITENRRYPWRWPLLPFLIYRAALNYRQDLQIARVMDPAIVSLLDQCREKGTEAAVQAIWQDRAFPEEEKQRRLRNAAVVAENDGDYELRYELLHALWRQAPSMQSARALVQVCEQTCRYQEAADLIQRLDAEQNDNPDPAEAEILSRLKRRRVYQMSLLRHVPARRSLQIDPLPKRIVYMLHNSLPHSSGGYATRTQGVMTGLKAAGADVVALTRPGYPLDITGDFKREAISLQDDVGGNVYHRILENPIKGKELIDYILTSADLLEQRFRELRPALVMAASNHRVGLMSAIAARRLGLPLVYEVRGRWEITKASRDQSYAFTDEFAVHERLENETAKLADHVITLTGGLRESLLQGGVEAENVSLLPNSCDPARFAPQPRDAALAARYAIPEDVPVIGYIGSFVDYEGLDDLARAAIELKRRGLSFRLLLVGNEVVSSAEMGPISKRIREIMQTGGAGDWLLMPGRVPYDEVAAHYSLLDITAFPRRPWQVCEMVSPMKPLEAMAMQKAVVVSSVRALMEMVRHEETGLIYAKGDCLQLANALHRLVGDGDFRSRLAEEGRRWVLRERTWETSAARIFPKLPFAAVPEASRGAA